MPSAGARHPGTAVPCISSLSWWFTGERFRRFPLPGVAGVLPSPPRYFRSVLFLFRNTILHRSELDSTDPLFHHDAHTSRLKRSGRAGSGSFRPRASCSCCALALRPLRWTRRPRARPFNPPSRVVSAGCTPRGFPLSPARLVSQQPASGDVGTPRSVTEPGGPSSVLRPLCAGSDVRRPLLLGRQGSQRRPLDPGAACASSAC